MSRRALHLAGFFTALLVVSLTADGQTKKPVTPKDTPRASSNVEMALGRLAPNKPMVFLTSNGWKKPDSTSQNKTEQLWAEESVQEFFRQLGEEIQKTIEEKGASDANTSVLAGTLPVLLKSMIQHPVAFTLNSFTPTAVPEIELSLIVDTEDEAPQIREAFEKLIKLAPDSGPDQLVEETISGTKFYHPKGNNNAELQKLLPRFGMSESFLIFTMGPNSTSEALEKIRGAGKAPAWLTSLLAEAKVERPSFAMQIDTESIWKTVTPLMTDPKGRAALEASGVMAMKRVATVSGLDTIGSVDKYIIETNGAPTGALALLPEKPLGLKDLKGIPASPANATIIRLNLKQFVEGVLKITDKVDPMIRQQFDQFAGQSDRMLGFSVKEDLLEAFGDLWCSYVSSTEAGGGFVPGLVVTASLRDVKKMTKIQDALVLRARDLLQKMGPQAPVSLQEFTARTAKGYRVQVNNVPIPVTPTWVLTKDQFVLGLSPQLVTAHMAVSNKSLADNADVKAALQRNSKAVVLSYRDPKPEIQGLYTLFNTFSPVMLGQLQQQGINFNMPPLPPYSDIEPHLAPSVMTISRDSKGWTSESRGVVSSVSAASPATLAVMTALLLPAVQQAREAARRTQAKNNLKQIGLSMFNYESAHARFPERAVLDKSGKPGLSWRVKILPFLDQKDLYDQFHLDEPWDSDHNKTLISRMPLTYSSPNDEELNQQGKTRYLILRGEGTMFAGEKGPAIADVKDGTSQTIMAVEADTDHAVVWTSPDDLELDFDDLLAGLRGARNGGFHALLADGSVRFVSENIDLQTLKALITSAGGETLGGF